MQKKTPVNTNVAPVVNTEATATPVTASEFIAPTVTPEVKTETPKVEVKTEVKAETPVITPVISNDILTIKEHNRAVIAPFVESFIVKLYETVDRAAEKGIAFSDTLTKETAERVLANVLGQLQKEFGNDSTMERGMFASVAFYTGVALGYPVEMINTVLRTIPLSAHFRAGFHQGQALASEHVVIVYNKFCSKSEDVKEFINSKIPKKEVIAAPANPVACPA